MDDLRKKLREKLREKTLARKPRDVRDERVHILEKRLKRCKDPVEKEKIKKELELLYKIEEQEENNIASEYPDYGDNATYGGGIEHDD
jgi:tRNA A37 methylthiotransferase MiaB